MKKLLYKVLDENMLSPFREYPFEVETEYVCRDFDANPTHHCSNGFYATGIDGLPYSFNIERQVWECEVSGKAVEIDQFKRRYEKLRLIRKLMHDEVKQLALEKEAEVKYKLSEVLFPINPLLINRRSNAIEKELELLKVWDSVRDSVRTSVGDSVRDSIRDSVWDFAWTSVRDSVWDSAWALVWASVKTSVEGSARASVSASVRTSVGDSVGAYIGSLFPDVKHWKYVESLEGVYPYQSVVELGKAGLVPCFYSNRWHLHAGEKAAVVWEENNQ